jgi:hypothetical protein
MARRLVSLLRRHFRDEQVTGHRSHRGGDGVRDDRPVTDELRYGTLAPRDDLVAAGLAGPDAVAGLGHE